MIYGKYGTKDFCAIEDVWLALEFGVGVVSAPVDDPDPTKKKANTEG